MKFAVLGSLDVTSDAEPPMLGARKLRIALAVLLSQPCQWVSDDVLTEALWNANPPRTAADNLRLYIHQLRRLLGEDRIDRRSGGYTLRVEPGELDSVRFEELAARGRELVATGQTERGATTLREALALWRGRPFADLDDVGVLRGEAARLAELQLLVREARVEADLTLGRYQLVVPDLTRWVAEHPLREGLWGQLMRALCLAGRQADALVAYRRVHRLLADELGVDPGAELIALHQAILNGELGAARGAAEGEIPNPNQLVPAAEPLTGRWPSPAPLPPDVADFTGRDAAVGQLRDLLSQPATSALVVAAIAGMGGVGKTALAVHVAHLVAAHYPDGQLYVNLRGAEPMPLDPADVLGRFLRALGVDSRAVPRDPAERAEMYRTRLAGRRVLVLLDNAAAEEQIRPLLPGASTCAVLITSRARMTGIEGARFTDLDVFSPDQGVELLARVVGAQRVADQLADAVEIVRLCGRLPLAVRVAGARLTARPTWRLAHLINLLADERSRLDRLATGDLAVRASLALSYQALAVPAQRLFRLLGLLDPSDLPAWLAAPLLETGLGEAATYVEALVDAQLLTISGVDPTGESRYRLHDLVRLYARERAELEETQARRAAALARAFGAFLAVAETMAGRVPGPCYAAIHGVAPRPEVDWAATGVLDVEPLHWFDSERATLLSAVRQCCAFDLDELAFDLAGCLEKYFDMRGMYLEWRSTNESVMAACQAAGNLLGEAVMLRGLIDVVTWNVGDAQGAAMARLYEDSSRLLGLFTALGNARGMADAQVMCAWGLAAQGRYPEATRAATTSLKLATGEAHLGGQARAEVALALVEREQGRPQRSVGHLERALWLARELGNPRYEATVLQFLGIAHREAGDLDESQRRLSESLAISRAYQDHYPEALTLLTLARVQLARGDPRAQATATASLKLGREYDMSHHVADSLEVLGQVELSLGRPEEAILHLRESVRLWRTRGWPALLAAALTTLGGALRERDPTGALAAWAEAHELFTALGNTARVDELSVLLKSVQP